MRVRAPKYESCVARALLLIAVTLTSALPCSAQEAQPASKELPVILLTGFEPFGGRGANASWEGVKALDGVEWNGYRLAARQMQVVWGAPLKQLEEWTKELRPVAVFSFGEGQPGSFALETEASNRRGGFPDNRNERPTEPAIVTGGPEELQASIDAAAIAKRLAAYGFPVRVSTEAGDYLCEECLYSLEYLKSGQKLHAHVMFCHVPPLGSEIEGPRVEGDYIAKFVGHVLAAYAGLYQATAPGTQPQEQKAAAADPREAELQATVQHYFRTWSNVQMDAYEECFLREACIQYVDDRGNVFSRATDRFFTEQRSAQRRSPGTEVPLSIKITFEAKLARAVVYWKLTNGKRVEFGYDHFTFMQRDGKWRILNLVFYGADPPGR